MKKFFYFFVIIIAMASCTQKETADLIVKNAHIYTVNETFDTAESFAVKDGKFIAVGSEKEILEKYTADTVLDMNGKSLYPGFIDPHCHFYGYGRTLRAADLRGTRSFDEITKILKAHAEKYPKGWILGRSWDQNDWEDKSFPTNDKLNEAFPDRPVLLTRVDGHAGIANQAALDLIGFSENTQIEGGKLEIKNGKLTGLLIEKALDRIGAIVPEGSTEEVVAMLKDAQQNCFEVGLTSVGDAGLDKNIVLIMDSLHEAGILKMRIYAMLNPTEENIEHFVKNGHSITDFLTVRSLKMYADGALGSRGACMLEPYSDDTGNYGIMVNTVDSISKVCKLAYENNYQINIHAIGDSANRTVLDIYKRFLKEGNDRRWRIEHAQVVHPDDFKCFGKYGIIPSVQTTHATSDMYWAEDRVGPERIKTAYAYLDLLKQNGWLPNGSDFPVEEINPLYGFYAGTARKDLKGFPPKGFQTENALSREQALRAMTIWAAKSAFEENKKGSIEIGKMADFVVTDTDIMKVSIDKVPNTKILKTFVAGEEVYSTTDF
jgi:predicted amidohydrolase YtcJ